MTQSSSPAVEQRRADDQRQADLPLLGHPPRWLWALYALCVAAFLATVPLPRVDGQLVGSDGVHYYAYLPTLLLDRDLDFANQYAQLLPAARVTAMESLRTPAGLLPNQFAVGTALLWAPFFLVAHGVALLLQALGAPVTPDGIGPLYQATVLVGSITYGFAGLWLLYRLCTARVGQQAAAVTVVLLWLATNVVYYMVAEPSMSHMCALFASSLFVVLWLKWRPVGPAWRWALLGAAGGLVLLVRTQDGTVLLLPVLDSLAALWGASGSRWRRLGQWVGRMACYGLSAFVLFLPQLAVWQLLNGSPVASGYLLDGEQGFRWLQPQLFGVLFSTWHGLFTWHPITLVAVLGLLWLIANERRLALLLLLGLALQVYLVGAWSAWFQGDAFGGRMFISSLPLLAPGLAAVVAWVPASRYRTAGLAAGLLLVGWNALFFLQYRLGYVPMGDPLTLEQMTTGKFAMLADLAQRASRLLAR